MVFFLFQTSEIENQSIHRMPPLATAIRKPRLWPKVDFQDCQYYHSGNTHTGTLWKSSSKFVLLLVLSLSFNFQQLKAKKIPSQLVDVILFPNPNFAEPYCSNHGARFLDLPFLGFCFFSRILFVFKAFGGFFFLLISVRI